MESDHIKALDLAHEGNWDESHKLDKMTPTPHLSPKIRRDTSLYCTN